MQLNKGIVIGVWHFKTPFNLLYPHTVKSWTWFYTKVFIMKIFERLFAQLLLFALLHLILNSLKSFTQGFETNEYFLNDRRTKTMWTLKNYSSSRWCAADIGLGEICGEVGVEMLGGEIHKSSNANVYCNANAAFEKRSLHSYFLTGNNLNEFTRIHFVWYSYVFYFIFTLHSSLVWKHVFSLAWKWSLILITHKIIKI